MGVTDTKIAMASAAAKALDYIKSKKAYEPEEVIKSVMNSLKASSSDKIPAIAAANEAMRIRRENTSMSDKQVMSKVMASFDEIMSR